MEQSQSQEKAMNTPLTYPGSSAKSPAMSIPQQPQGTTHLWSRLWFIMFIWYARDGL